MKYQKSYKEILERIAKSWYLLVVFAVLGVFVAFFYNRSVFPSYQVTTTLLYKPNHGSQPVFTDQAQIAPTKRPSLENQVGIISSYSLVLQTLRNLGWNIYVAEKGVLSDNDLYKREPFLISVDTTNNRNLLNVPITITPVSATEYKVKTDAIYERRGLKRKIEFEGRGTFGKEFKNQYFQFTIQKNNEDVDMSKDYIVEFPDLDLMALDYQKKLDLKLADKESDLIYVSIDSKNVPRAVGFLNELVKVYVQFGIDEKNRQANNTISFIDNQIFGIKDSLQKASNNLSSYRSRTQTVDVNKESGIALERYQNINAQEAEIRMRNEYYSTLRNSLNDNKSMKNLAAPSVVGVQDPALNSNILKLSELTSQREVLSHTLQEGNPNLVSLDKEISFTRSSLEKNLDNLVMNTRIQLGTLNQQRSSISSQLSSLPMQEQNLVGIQRKFDLNNQLYTYLLQKRAEAGIVKASNFSDVEVLDPASDATAKQMGHANVVNLGIGFISGLTVIILYFLIHTYLDKRIYNIEQIHQSLDTKVYGLINKNTLKTPLVVFQYPQSSITESFRSLRTSIQQSFRKDPGKKVISLNSCVVGEGKTFITLNLACILSKNNKKVLIIDTDLRKPKLHKLVGCSNEKGLSDYLSENKTIDEIILATEYEGLSIISAGPIPYFPSELINTTKLEALINEVKKRYDYVILKNAPVGIINDAKTIFPLTDLNLFVVKMMFSTGEQLELMNSLAKDFPMANFGVVINRAQSALVTREKSYGYYSEKKAVEAGLN